MSVSRLFFKYVPQNMLGMLGISLYILADTFFIAQAVGADGITALNLVLPIYNLIFAIGAMIGVGSAIRFAVSAGGGTKDHDRYFFNALFWGTIFGIIFTVLGIAVPDKILMLLGADGRILAAGTTYTRIFMIFGPIFIWNHICNAFVRNDGCPSIAMAATLTSSLFNIAADYVLMFPLGLGMAGAALATACSPILGVLICCIHFRSSGCTIRLKMNIPSFKKMVYCCQVGISSFVGEISSGVTTMIFNFLILGLAGNIGVAAYGVVANTSLVAVSLLNGIAQGSQPIISLFHGRADGQNVRKTMALGLISSLVLSVVMLMVICFWAEPIANLFNSEHDPQLTMYAMDGLKLYFIGFIFAGINIVGASAFSAMEKAKEAFLSSILRGFILISLSAWIMSMFLKMTGVWLAFPVAEALTLLITLILMERRKKNEV